MAQIARGWISFDNSTSPVVQVQLVGGWSDSVAPAWTRDVRSAQYAPGNTPSSP